MSSIKPFFSNPDRWAQFRFSIIGPLLSAPPAEGQLAVALADLAARTWRHPFTGKDLKLGLSTIERWYYMALKGPNPVVQLRTKLRGTFGTFPSLAQPVIAELTQLHTQYPEWSTQLHYDNLAVVCKEKGLPTPSYSTLRRYRKFQEMHRTPRPKSDTDGAQRAMDRLQEFEVRSYEVPTVNGLWHLDFHHASRSILSAAGEWVKPMLLAIMDDNSRLMCHAQWFLDETTESLVHGLGQAFMKYGVPRALMTDNGSAMTSEEFITGLHRLGVEHRRTLAYSPYQNGKNENIWGRIEGRFMPMLGDQSMQLNQINHYLCAWVEGDYNNKTHSELSVPPRDRFRNGDRFDGPRPEPDQLRDVFRIDVKRRVRRSDCTISLEGKRFEIPAHMGHCTEVTVRYARWDLSYVHLVDPRSGAILFAIRPIDKTANADGQRRRKSEPNTQPQSPRPMAPLMRKFLADHAATGRPPAYIPKGTDEAPTHDTQQGR